jgi:hypothetical protein
MNLRSAFCFVLAALLAGCATAPDPVDRLVTGLSASNGIWQDGSSPRLDLPETASPELVVRAVFLKTRFGRRQVKHCYILKIRQVQIPGGLTDDYTAVLVQTDLGEKIVLYHFFPEIGCWNRVFDVTK